MANNSTTAFLSARGTFYRVDLEETQGAGLYAIRELDEEITSNAGIVQVDHDDPNSTAVTWQDVLDAPILLLGIKENKSDAVSQMPCLDNVKTFYTFGQNFGSVQIVGEVYLGALGDMNLEGANQLELFFKKNRVSNRRKPITVSIGKTSFFVYLTGMQIGNVDTEFHILPFVFEGTLLDLQNENGDLINPDSTILTGDLLDSDSALETALSVRNPVPPVFDEENKAGITADASATVNNTPSTAVTSNAGPTPNPSAALLDSVIKRKPLTADESQFQDSLSKRNKIQKFSKEADVTRFDQADGKKLEELKTRLKNQNISSQPVSRNSVPPVTTTRPVPFILNVTAP